jgi:predicted transcriptional regulator
MTIRLPDDVRAELDAVAWALDRPRWQVLVDAILAYVGKGKVLTEADQAAVRKAVRAKAGS